MVEDHKLKGDLLLFRNGSFEDGIGFLCIAMLIM